MSPLRPLCWLCVFLCLAMSGEYRSLRAQDGPHRLDAFGDPLPPLALARLGTTRWRHLGGSAYLAYSADGKTLAFANDEAMGYVEVSTGRKLEEWPLTQDVRMSYVAFSADGRCLAFIPRNGKLVSVWDIAAGRARREIPVAQRKVHPLALAPDGSILATCEDQRQVCVWRVKDGKQLAALQGEVLVFGPDNTLFLGEGNRVRVWNDGKSRELLEVEGAGRLLALSGDGRALATRTKQAIRLWDAATGKPKQTIPVNPENFSGADEELLLSADGRTVLLQGETHLGIWDGGTGKERLCLSTKLLEIGAPALSPDGKTFAWSTVHFFNRTHSHVIRRWDIETNREVPPPPGHQRGIASIAFAPDGKKLASGAMDETVRLWSIDLQPGKAVPGPRSVQTEQPAGYPQNVWVAWSPDGKLLAIIQSRDEIALRDAASGELVRKLMNAKSWEQPVFSPNGRLLAARDLSSAPIDRIVLWETGTGRVVQTLDRCGFDIASLAFSPDGKRLAAGGGNSLRVWDVTTGKLTSRLPEKNRFRPWGAAVFTPDGRCLVGGTEGGVVVWDLATGKELRFIGEDITDVPNLALSPDGRVLATTAEDGLIHLWDLASGKKLAHFGVPWTSRGTLAFSPDGKILAQGRGDSTILLWDVPAALEAGVNRPRAALTREDLTRLWDELGQADAERGHRAVWALVGEPESAVAFFAERLAHQSKPTELSERLARLIKQLDDDDFDRREMASRELAQLKAVAAPAFRAALAQNPSAEVKQRIKDLLGDQPVRLLPVPTAEGLRGVRAIEVLERIGSAEARRLLLTLKNGPPSYASLEARAALERLETRTGGKR